MFTERPSTPFTSQDIRFTTKGDTLYAFLLARPLDNTITIASLASGSPLAGGGVERVQLLGASAPLEHTRDGSGLTITLPDIRPSSAVTVTAFAISGRGIVQS